MKRERPKSPKWKWDIETIRYCEKHNLPLPPSPPTNELLREGDCESVSMIEEI